MFFLILDNLLEIGFRLLLWVLYLYLNKWAPYIRHIEEEELWYYRYPSVTSFIPIRYLYVIMIGVPFSVYFIHFLCSTHKRENSRYLQNQFLGISLAYCITAIFTAVLKLIIGRPRPNFFFRCFPDGVGIEVQNCTGEWEGQMDGRKSFPSAHSSFSFTGMVYVTCYLFNEINFSQPYFGRGIVFFLALQPLMIAMIISLSRACDYHHHYSDIIGGALLGTAVSLFVFHFYKDTNQEKEEKYRENVNKVKLFTEQELMKQQQQ